MSPSGPLFPVSDPHFPLLAEKIEMRRKLFTGEVSESDPTFRGSGERAPTWPPSTSFPPTPDDVADFEAFIASQLGAREGEERADLERYLRAFPGATVREWKGKGDLWHLSGSNPDERPWHKLKAREVRALATRHPARTLPHSIRQAAARDPGLIWNPLARRYRLRAAATRAPPLATGGHVDGAGASKVPDTASSRPAAVFGATANPIFPAGREPDHDA